MITAHTFPVQRTAHYYTIGVPNAQVRYVWLVCHGYGQLAQHFIRKFDTIAADADALIIAPEGLSRFYTEGLSGRVGASWMTREDRLLEIADYCNYLSALYNNFITPLHHDVKIVLMGFSQGCATQLRWIMRDFPRFDYLLLWAGMPPEDLDYQSNISYFDNKEVHCIYGTGDPFLQEERLLTYQQLLDSLPFPIHTRTFEGAHTVDRATLRQWYDDIRSSKRVSL